MKKSLLYTRTGDQGTTSLVGGVRVPKNHARLEAYGSMDELNAHIGFLITLLKHETDIAFLQRVQNNLFTVGSYLATDQTSTMLRPASVVSKEMVEALEARIDEIDALLPPQRAFILPGGSQASAVCHICRTVCRRVERRVLTLMGEVEISSEVLAYINRLSDYFFVLSRKINYDEKKEEIFWNNSCQ